MVQDPQESAAENPVPGGGIEKKAKKEKKDKPERGVETMFRITAGNQMRLSEMADNKAHILLTINSIIVSVLLSFMFRKLDEEPQLLLPSILFLTTSLVTVVSAILVIMPKINHVSFSRDDIETKKANLLFFGNYYKMDLNDYEWGINSMIEDPKYLYSSLIRDNYYLGKLLGKKYRMLRTTYAIFMFGFVTSVLFFILVEILFKNRS